MIKLRQIFFRGLVTLTPLVLSLYLLYAAFSIFDNWFGALVKSVFSEQSYIPGFGFLLFIFLVFIFGLLLGNIITDSIWTQIEKKITEVPLIKAVYSPLRDLMNLFAKGKRDLKSVVLVEIQPGINAFGLVTRDQFKDIQKWPESQHHLVPVYIPLSYALGGYTLLVDKTKLKPVDIPVERALSLAITAWVKTKQESSES